jgi:ABC-type transport system substrate-binding protein
VLYGPEFLEWPFEADYANAQTYLVNVAQYLLPSSSFPETHFNNARFNRLYDRAVATADLNLRREIGGEMQRIEYDEGSYILPIFAPVLDACAASVHGIQEGRGGLSFNSYNLTGAWIE